MSDETALLRAIAAHPDEDTPRLIYADWLDEQGRAERATFIRGQIELAQLKDDSPRRREVAYQCRRLLDAHEQEWLDPRDAFSFDWGWSRGFVETFTTTPADLESGNADLFVTHPFRRVWLWELGGDADGVSLLPKDNHITALDLIGNNLNVSQLRKLAKMTHLPHLRELGLMFNNLRDSAVKMLCDEPFFQRLELIRLGANPFGWRARNELNRLRGRVSFNYERRADYLYTIREDYLNAGWGNDFTQLLIYSVMDEQWLAVFDHAGNLLRTEQRSVAPGALHVGVTRGAARDAWLQELGHSPATIRVKEFQLPQGRLALNAFAPQARIYDQAEYRPRDHLEDDLVEWLNEGRFQFDMAGHVLRLNRDGVAVE